MFARLFAVAALASFVFAQGSGECSTGNINCCTGGTHDAQDMHSLFSQFGINELAGVTGAASTGCSPSGIAGVGDNGATCSQQPVCCNDNYFGGLVSVGCSPINVGL